MYTLPESILWIFDSELVKEDWTLVARDVADKEMGQMNLYTWIIIIYQ